jgi:phage shock protein A
MSSADEGAAGISASLGDEGAALQRAQDKIATMQARAGALDELPQSGVLEDAGSDTHDIQQELDEAGSPPKRTTSSPRLRPRPARAHRRRPS